MENTPAKSKLYQPIPLEIQGIGEKVLDSAYTVHSAQSPTFQGWIYPQKVFRRVTSLPSW